MINRKKYRIKSLYGNIMEWQDGSKVQDYVADWCERLVKDECESFLERKFDKKTTLEDYYDEVYGYN